MFGLDPHSIVQRVKASGQPTHILTAGESARRGMIGFTLVSLGGFAPWVVAGRWFYRNVGELGLYVVCAVMFIGLSGVLLHQLIIGPGSRRRFYQIFSLAFVGYAAAWTISWFAFRGVTGGIVGAIAGIAVMSGVLAIGFGARKELIKIFLILTVVNVAGYFSGEWAHNLVLALKEGSAAGLELSAATRSLVSKAAWGVFYGLGSGAGIGLAFYFCQTEARKLLAETTAPDHS